ncbi:MAG: hypothetical protein Q7R63_01755 [bacterium]|nr:hypothetical protein [bacterium]
MSQVTPGQLAKLLTLVNQKKVSERAMQHLLEGGYLADLFQHGCDRERPEFQSFLVVKLPLINKATGKSVGSARIGEITGGHLKGNYYPMINFDGVERKCFLRNGGTPEAHIEIDFEISPYA